MLIDFQNSFTKTLDSKRVYWNCY